MSENLASAAEDGTHNWSFPLDLHPLSMLNGQDMRFSYAALCKMYAYISIFGLDLGSISTFKNVAKYVSVLIIQNL